jgi:hypothetical protein
MKVKTNDVTSYNDWYLTAGKEYEVIETSELGFRMIDDEGRTMNCCFKDCMHLPEGGTWEVINEGESP